MKIEKRGKNSYRVRKQLNGQKYELMFDYRPTQREISLALAEKVRSCANTGALTFGGACEKYILSKENVLSSSTIKAYKCYINAISYRFMRGRLADLTQIDVQREINDLSAKHSAKYVRNLNGFIMAVIRMYRPDCNIKPSLPPKPRKEPYIPTMEDIQRLLDEAKGTRYEIPLELACYGLRRSEILALTVFDIKDDVIYINKAKVPAEGGGHVLRHNTKTSSSTRKVVISKELANKIRKQGYVYQGHPNSISDWMTDTEKRLGMQHFTIHKLRHFYASKLAMMGVPEAVIMDLGGWSTPHVMKEVYRHNLDKDNLDKMREVNKDYWQLFGN